MKKIMKATVLLAGAWLMQGCGLDNYDEPEAQFSGRVTYQGEPLQLRHGSIKFDLEQDSYELGDKIEVAMIVNPWNLRLRVVSSSILKWCRITCSGIRISRFRAIRSTEFVP